MNVLGKLIALFFLAAAFCAAIGLALFLETHAARAVLGAAAPEALDRIRQLALALMVVPAGGALVLGVGLARTLGRRLARLTAGARALADDPLAPRLADDRPDEIGALARALDQMAERLATSTRAHARAEMLLDAIADPVCVVDREGRVTRVNRAAAALAPRDAARVVGPQALDVFSGDDADRRGFLRALAGRDTMTGFETRLRVPSGDWLPVRLSATRLRTPDGKPDGLVLSAHDASEIHHARAALAAARDAAEAAARAVQTAPAPDVAPAAPARLRLLVAEDNLVNQRVLRRAIERLGYATDVVADGEEVLAALARAPYDVVFMDLRMPRLDGLAATRRLRADPTIAQPRVVAMTADVTPARRAACEAAGMDAFLGKPIDRAALAEVLAAFAADLPPGAVPLPLPDAAHQPPADPFATLLDAVDGNVALYDSLLVDTRQGLVDEDAALRHALKAVDLPTAARHAHTLKTLAALLGTLALRDHAATVEAHADEGELTATVHAYLPMHAEARAVLERLDAALAAAGEPVPALVYA